MQVLQQTGALLFLSSSLMMRCISRTRFRSFSKTPFKPSSALIELDFPSGDCATRTRLRNEFILNYIVARGLFSRYFICIKDVPSVCSSKWLSYVSELYSRSWNDAVVRKQYEVEFVVLRDEDISTHFIGTENISSVFCGSGTTHRHNASAIGTSDITAVLDLGFLNNRIIFLESDDEYSQINRYNSVAVGGSFDHLHSGHRKLLYAAATLSQNKLLVGITGSTLLVNKEHRSLIQDYDTRKLNVEDFLACVGPHLESTCVQIEDPFGPTITDSTLEAIVVSSETIIGAFKINDIRVNKGLRKLDVLVVDRNDAAVLSSTFIRKMIVA